MIRHWIPALLGLAAVASCTAAPSWPPGSRGAGTELGQYLIAREAALTGQGPALESGVIASPKHAPIVVPRKAAAATTATPVTTAPPPAQAPRHRATLTRSQAGTDAGAVLRRYAEMMDNDPGEARFRRKARVSASDAQQACSRFASAEAAQLTFIANGGPNADPLGLDPDGDGYVCGWDPRPLRRATGN